MSVNKRCPSCGYTVEDGMISCPMCGEPLDIKIVKKGHPILSVVLLLVLWPIGIAIMWATETFQKRTRVVITVIYLLLFLFYHAIIFLSTHTPKRRYSHANLKYSRRRLRFFGNPAEWILLCG